MMKDMLMFKRLIRNKHVLMLNWLIEYIVSYLIDLEEKGQLNTDNVMELLFTVTKIKNKINDTEGKVDISELEGIG